MRRQFDSKHPQPGDAILVNSEESDSDSSSSSSHKARRPDSDDGEVQNKPVKITLNNTVQVIENDSDDEKVAKPELKKEEQKVEVKHPAETAKKEPVKKDDVKTTPKSGSISDEFLGRKPTESKPDTSCIVISDMSISSEEDRKSAKRPRTSESDDQPKQVMSQTKGGI